MADDTVTKFDVVDAPTNETTPTEDTPDTTYIVHRTPDGDVRMRMSEWPAYAKENDL